MRVCHYGWQSVQMAWDGEYLWYSVPAFVRTSGCYGVGLVRACPAPRRVLYQTPYIICLLGSLRASFTTTSTIPLPNAAIST